MLNARQGGSCRDALSSFCLALVVAALLAGCERTATGPRVVYSFAASPGTPGSGRVYVAALSDTTNNQPIALTVLDPVTGRALDTFPLSAAGPRPCGLAAQVDGGEPIAYGSLDGRYIPIARWESAAKGQAPPFRVRIYFRSDQGEIWEAEVSARYRACVTKS